MVGAENAHPQEQVQSKFERYLKLGQGGLGFVDKPLQLSPPQL